MSAPLPKSDSHLGTNLLGFAVALSAIFALKGLGLSPLDTALLVLTAGALPILFIEHFVFKRYREAAAGFASIRALDVRRVAIKCVGLLSILAFFAFLYWLFPEYKKSLYSSAWPFLLLVVIISVLGAPFYFAWCDKRQNDPEDGYYHLGKIALLQFNSADSKPALRLMRNWLVKAFFLPLMFVYTLQSIHGLQTFELGTPITFLKAFTILYSIIFFGDLLFAAIGYVLTLRIFNAHIRSSEPTLLGWVSAVICYAPFWGGFIAILYLNYDDNRNWQQIIPEGALQYAWGIAILVLYCVYSLATICLGIRFSNLTYRGLVTSGPYRFTKHPAYVAKNLSWWLISLPFISDAGFGPALAATTALIGVNLLYFIRARTEENHLSNYPEYVVYAEAMNERSIFAPLAKRLPFLAYKKNPSKI